MRSELLNDDFNENKTAATVERPGRSHPRPHREVRCRAQPVSGESHGEAPVIQKLKHGNFYTDKRRNSYADERRNSHADAYMQMLTCRGSRVSRCGRR